MFLTKQELFVIYKKIKSGEATTHEQNTFELNLMSGCSRPEVIIEEFDRDIEKMSKNK